MIILQPNPPILTIKHTKRTNFSNLFFVIKLYMFRTIPLSIITSFSLYTREWYMPYKFVDCLRAGSGRNCSSCSQAFNKPAWHIPFLSLQWKAPDDGQSNCPKHVEFYSKNKFEKLLHLVGFIIRIFHDARSHERRSPLMWSNKCIFLT